MLRSIAAVLLGIVFIAVLSNGGANGLQAISPEAFDAAGRTQSVPLLIALILSVGVFAVAGCYLTARVAGRRPMLHALVLGGFGVVFNALGAFLLWDTAPVWYHVASITLAMPYAWMGGKLREMELAHAPAAPAPAAPAPDGVIAG